MVSLQCHEIQVRQSSKILWDLLNDDLALKLSREQYTYRATDWCMEEYPTACQPQLDAASMNPEYFLIKDEATGKVLEINDDGVAFAESNGLSKQFWFWYREYKSDAEDGVMHIINRLNNRMLEVHGKESDEYKEVTHGNSYWLKDESHQMWKKSNGKIFSTKEGYTVLAVRDNKVVVLKEGNDTTVGWSEDPEQTFPLAIKGDKCPDSLPPPEGKCNF